LPDLSAGPIAAKDPERESNLAETKVSPALKQAELGEQLYFERNRLAHRAYRLPLRDIRRLNDLIARLSDDELRMVAAYAEGLAEWSAPEQPSEDATGSGAD
jgi:cytochrome c553